MFFFTSVIASLAAATAAAGTVNCSGTFNAISAATWINGADPGWNLGNTLDAIPTEGSWNNPPVDFATFDVVKKAGFKSVRLPGIYHLYSNRSVNS